MIRKSIICYQLSNEGTKERRNEGTKERSERRNEGTKERRNEGTKNLTVAEVDELLHAKDANANEAEMWLALRHEVFALALVRRPIRVPGSSSAAAPRGRSGAKRWGCTGPRCCPRRGRSRAWKYFRPRKPRKTSTTSRGALEGHLGTHR